MAGAFHNSDATVSARSAAAVVLDADMPTTRGLYVGTSGNLTVLMANDVGGTFQVTFANVPSGVFPVQVTRVVSATTTALNIVALW